MAPAMEREPDRAGGCWGKPAGRSNCPGVPNGCGKFSCVCASVYLDRPFNLRVRFPSHARRFQKVGSTLGHWAAGPEQGGDSKSYIGVGFSESLGPGKTGPGPGEWPE